VSLDTRIAAWRHLDGAVFIDAGNVAAKFSAINLDKRDYGVGLRLHTERATIARVDVAHGDDGWRFMFRMTDPLHMSRLSRQTAAIPFVQ
jgi:outer membrane translocation and assembly module TamA